MPEPMPLVVLTVRREPTCVELAYFLPRGHRIARHILAGLRMWTWAVQIMPATCLPSSGVIVCGPRQAKGMEGALRFATGHLVRDFRLPVAEPCIVCDIRLDPVESGRFRIAVHEGELVIPADLPASSRLPEAWERWCRENRWPHRVSEERP